nr:zinc dependent phospholipase C family protein [Pleionea sp. CnH1-48]
MPALHAFKVNTHVWIADEIIKDLEDGKLTIYVNGTARHIPVSHATRSYILNHQDEFRAGSLGPDAFPDPIVGQLLIHPGPKNPPTHYKTWGTDEWLKHILNNASVPPEKSFAYGNLVHAASDAFAHTYVNLYTGDIFDVGAHLGVDTEADRRHFLLESFIGNYTPNLPSGKAYQNAVNFPDTKKYIREQRDREYQQCILESRRENLNLDCNRFVERFDLSKPDYLMRTFFYDPNKIKELVAANGSSSGIIRPAHIQQYGDAATEASLGGLHIRSIYDLRYRIEQMIQSQALQEMDILITQAVVYYWTDIELSDSEAAVLDDLHKRIKNLEYDSVEELQRIKNQIEDIVQNSTLKIHKHTENVTRKIDQLNRSVFSLHSQVLDLERKIHDLEDKIDRISCPKWDPICNALNRLKRKLRDAKSKHDRAITDFFRNRNLLTEAVKQLHETVRSVELVRRNLDDAVVDFAQILMKDVNPIRAMLINWAEGIDAAMLSYRTVGMNMMQEAMKTNGNTLQPLQQWAFGDCNIAKLIGIGNEFSNSICKLNRSLEGAFREIQELMPYINNGVLLGNVQSRLNEIKDAEVRRLKEKLIEQLVDYSLKKINPELKEFLEIIRQGVNDTTINTEFGKSGNNPGYLVISDMSQRVKKEMRMTSSYANCRGKSSCFNKNTYPVIHNALQLSKLALLDNNGLNTVSGYVGRNIMGENLNTFDKSLLIGAINSIDGNHHWYGKATPPLPRKPSVDGQSSFRYEWKNKYYGEGSGKLFGASSSARQTIMYALFKGPLNEGLFVPKALNNFNNLLSTKYKLQFNACKGHPFQLSPSDSYCDNVQDIYEGGNGGGDDGGSGGGSGGGPILPPWDDCGGNTGRICR